MNAIYFCWGCQQAHKIKCLMALQNSPHVHLKSMRCIHSNIWQNACFNSLFSKATKFNLQTRMMRFVITDFGGHNVDKSLLIFKATIDLITTGRKTWWDRLYCYRQVVHLYSYFNCLNTHKRSYHGGQLTYYWLTVQGNMRVRLFLPFFSTDWW